MQVPAILAMAIAVAAMCVQSSAEEHQKTITIQAPPALIPIGAYCKVATVRNDSGEFITSVAYHGYVTEATQRGVRLNAVLREGRQERKPPAWAGLHPTIQRQFRNIGVGRSSTRDVVWVPIAKIDSVTLLDKAIEDENLRERTPDGEERLLNLEADSE